MMIQGIVSVDKRKCKVFLEEGFAFLLYKSEAERYGIKEGEELSDPVYRKLVEEVLKPRAKEYALYLLGSFGRTSKEMEGKLQKAGYPPEVCGFVMKFLEEYRLLDDRAYASSYVRTYGRKKSKRQLIYELQQKGISSQIVGEALLEEPINEEECVREALCKRLKGRTEISYEEINRLGAWLGRKGYSFDVIKRVFREFCD